MAVNINKKNPVWMVVAFVLWVITFALGLWDIMLIWQLALRTYARFVPSGQGYALVSNLIIIPLMIAGVAVSIGSAEYHRTRWGTPESWRFFSRILAIELTLLMLPLFL